jgi:hypothetical protein
MQCVSHSLQTTDVTAVFPVILTASHPRDVFRTSPTGNCVSLNISVLVWLKVFRNPLKHEIREKEIWGHTMLTACYLTLINGSYSGPEQCSLVCKSNFAGLRRKV